MYVVMKCSKRSVISVLLGYRRFQTRPQAMPALPHHTTPQFVIVSCFSILTCCLCCKVWGKWATVGRLLVSCCRCRRWSFCAPYCRPPQFHIFRPLVFCLLPSVLSMSSDGPCSIILTNPEFVHEKFGVYENMY